MWTSLKAAPFVAAVLLIGFGCGPRDSQSRAKSVRLAFFPNVTHAAALVGTARGTFASALGSGIALEELVFNAGPAEIEALFGDQVDIGYIGPGPALNGFLKSRGKALKIIAGASSGGASLVIRADSGITAIKGLAGKRVASPQTGGTQDISLRHALAAAGLAATDKGGNVTLLPTANADTLTLFIKKELDAAWAPEPWVARLVKEAGGKILVDERDRWPDRKFATTVVIVRTKFLERNPDLVRRFIAAHLDVLDWMKENPDEARTIIGGRIKTLTRKAIPDEVLRAALSRTDFTYAPLKETVLTFSDWARELGFTREGRDTLAGLFELSPLNDELKKRGRATAE